ncbi:MAG: hypothetical protein ACK4RW_00355 [Rehaibacterium terrae]|uniref:hypothetical protein n=1 Tax=Rehaibacterium terrae TaxID=1341696 RepID=UPI00391C0CC1
MAELLWLLIALALAISGLSGYAIFGPLTYRHLQDQQRVVGESAFDPPFLRWILAARYRYHGDPVLPTLATPARWLLATCLLGTAGVLAWLVWRAL